MTLKLVVSAALHVTAAAADIHLFLATAGHHARNGLSDRAGCTTHCLHNAADHALIATRLGAGTRHAGPAGGCRLARAAARATPRGALLCCRSLCRLTLRGCPFSPASVCCARRRAAAGGCWLAR